MSIIKYSVAITSDNTQWSGNKAGLVINAVKVGLSQESFPEFSGYQKNWQKRQANSQYME